MKLNPSTAARRKFLAAAPLLSACGGGDVASTPITDAALAAQMSAKLNAQLGDAATVDAIVPALTDVGFTWDLPTVPATQIGTIVYLSTAGVAAEAVTRAGGAAAMGAVAVVGHRDHAKRCIQTSQLAGMKAAAVAEVSLPTVYDPQSGQPWTRNRSLYLVHDMYAQMLTRAIAATMQAFPKG